jgi:hypothetical protein
MRVRWGIALACTIAVSLAFAPARGWAQHGAPAANNKTAVTHSVTWWCVDVNDVWKVKVPAVLPIQFFVPPDPSPIPEPCRPTYLGTVPNGSSFAAGATWFTNKTYPPAVRDALQQQGYNFHGQSPAEDFMFKLADIRVEVRTYPGSRSSSSPTSRRVRGPSTPVSSRTTGCPLRVNVLASRWPREEPRLRVVGDDRGVWARDPRRRCVTPAHEGGVRLCSDGWFPPRKLNRQGGSPFFVARVLRWA